MTGCNVTKVSSFKAHCRKEWQITTKTSFRFCYEFVLHYYRSTIPPTQKLNSKQLNSQDCRYSQQSIFHPNIRNKVTVSRTNISQPTGRKLQILLVTAPGEAAEDVARAKLNGINMMGKTAFPTGDEFWRFTPGEFPKRAIIHINNLPVLMETEELEEVLSLPESTNQDVLQRETLQTEAGTVYSGRARIPIIINSKEHEDALLNWSPFTYSYVVVTYSHLVTYSQIHSQHAICKINCVLLRSKRRVEIIALYPNFWHYIRTNCVLLIRRRGFENVLSHLSQHAISEFWRYIRSNCVSPRKR